MREKVTAEHRIHGVKREETGEHRSIFCIHGITNLLTLCRHLIAEKYTYDSSAYRDTEQDVYYLIATEGSMPQEGFPKYPILREYSFLTMSLAHFIRVIEHCRVICDKNAVEILGKLA
ncbi:MAG: adaptor protein MecA [Clostridia bacterium]|nr:adaptor protein MecA [Clostridia bacterium]